MQEDLFSRYPDFSISADPLDPVYRIRYTEVVKEHGVVRFERREKRVRKEDFRNIIKDILSCKEK
jgi:hypothetical protein